MKNEYKNNPRWICFSNFIYGEAGAESGTPLWSRYVNTEKEAEEINNHIPNKDEWVASLQAKRAEE